MKTLITIILTSISLALSAQTELITTVSSIESLGNTQCAQIAVTNTNNVPMQIEGQNVRMFYNSNKLQFDNVSFDGYLSDSKYNHQIVTDKAHLSKKDANQLAFDADMGFLNYNVTLEENFGYEGVLEAGESAVVQSVCFVSSSKINADDIVLAAEGRTNEYSVAYVEIDATPIIDEILSPLMLMDAEYHEEIAGLHK